MDKNIDEKAVFKNLQNINDEKINSSEDLLLNSEVAIYKLCRKNNEILKECFKANPNNTDINQVVQKIVLVDFIYSTKLSMQKNKIHVGELADKICKVEDFDKRVANDDPKLVNELAENGKTKLFSFASKYCYLHNYYVYGKDGYSILDSTMKNIFPTCIKENNLINEFSGIKTNLEYYQNNLKYKEYNDLITKFLDLRGIKTEYRKSKFDHFVWLYAHQK
jgi:hypothetical protein